MRGGVGGIVRKSTWQKENGHNPHLGLAVVSAVHSSGSLLSRLATLLRLYHKRFNLSSHHRHYGNLCGEFGNSFWLYSPDRKARNTVTRAGDRTRTGTTRVANRSRLPFI